MEKGSFTVEVKALADIITFQEEYPSIDSYWRSVILFGRNVASYKFALAKSLLEIVETGKTIITLEDLAVPFSKNLCEHIANSPKQATCKSSKFLDACKQYNSGIIEHDQLINITVQLGFNNVLDAFHTVNFKKVPVKFFEKDFSYGRKRIILTDSIFKLQEVAFFDNFMYEAEACFLQVGNPHFCKIFSSLQVGETYVNHSSNPFLLVNA
ncbi:MAG: hypothetical protein GX024_07830 [Clostridiales bacterium]|nr:hypothetical protein [Clostridiales bacterium]